jgi:hypothetical protein
MHFSAKVNGKKAKQSLFELLFDKNGRDILFQAPQISIIRLRKIGGMVNKIINRPTKKPAKA